MARVVGLVGASGTGKSHRASMVALDQSCEAIIDDGLLISGGKILAGESAKRADTKIEAIRRAIFSRAGQAEELRAALARIAPEGILVLGTSRAMVEKICETLRLGPPGAWVAIEDLVDAGQIQMAQRLRHRFGRHVIPAPMVEVRKTFSGYLVDPLHFILKKGREAKEEDVVVEKSVVRPTWSYLGRFTVDDRVVATIAAGAAAETEGIAHVRRVLVESLRHGVDISVEVTVYFGYYIPGLLEEARRRIIEMVEHMTALNVLQATVVAKRAVTPPKGLEQSGRRVLGE